MSKVCAICGKGKTFEHNVSHSNRKTNRPVNANLQAGKTALRDDVAVRAEIVGLVHRPSLPGILEFHEYAGSFPLHIEKYIKIRAVSI